MWTAQKQNFVWQENINFVTVQFLLRFKVNDKGQRWKARKKGKIKWRARRKQMASGGRNTT
jgi:hypothetical protein